MGDFFKKAVMEKFNVNTIESGNTFKSDVSFETFKTGLQKIVHESGFILGLNIYPEIFKLRTHFTPSYSQPASENCRKNHRSVGFL